MAPATTEYQTHDQKLSTMSNPNTQALASSLRNVRTSSTVSSTSRVVYVGKDQQPITLPKMASMNSNTWKKSASFSTLATAVEGLVDAHSVADIMSLVSSELPNDTGAAFQESANSAKMIVDSILNVGFLDPVAWLTSGGNDIKIPDPTDLSVRFPDIHFIRFRCQMNGSSVDARVSTVPDLSFYFCLKLPQSTYNGVDGTVTAIGGGTTQNARSSVAQNLFSTPIRTPTANNLANVNT